ncbi:hypothetical protein EJ110_NYTH00416 [Nymphaea thermarum]|nr:hypothetical protein EJ110_NYTH00416 [Nymphaea thermarum]
MTYLNFRLFKDEKLLCLSLHPLLLSKQSHPPRSLRIRIKLQERTEVLQRIFLERPALNLRFCGLHNRLHFIGVNDSGEVGICQLRPGKNVAGLFLRHLVEGTVDCIQLLEGAFGPNDEPTQMTTGSKLKEIKPVHACHFDARDIAESLDQLRSLGSVDNQGALARNVAAIAHLSLTRTNGSARLRALYVRTGANLVQELQRRGRLLDRFDAIRQNERQLWNGLDTVAAGEDEGRHGGGGQGRGHGESALVDIDFAVPAAPDLCRGEHPPTTTHVPEGTLAGAVRATTGNTGNTGDGTASAPGLSRGLVTGAPGDRIRLAFVLGEVVVNKGDDVRPDRSAEDVRERDGRRGAVDCHIALHRLDGHQRAGCGDGGVEKLKVDQCKIYLRKYGLRLTGKKDVLVGRIKEHLEYASEIAIADIRKLKDPGFCTVEAVQKGRRHLRKEMDQNVIVHLPETKQIETN